METDPAIDMNKYWKLVMISSGNTDLCHLSCSRPSHLAQFRENVRRALDILIEIPNILIAVVSPPDPSLIQAALHRPVSCQLLTRTLCPCVTSGAAKSRAEFLADLQSYRAELLSLTSASQYRGRDNARLLLLTALHSLQLPPDQGLNLRLERGLGRAPSLVPPSERNIREVERGMRRTVCAGWAAISARAVALHPPR